MIDDYVLAVIPARSGSKSIKDKNIRVLNSKPLMAYSITQAIKSNKIDRVIVSTDSKKYSRIAKDYGAEVPYLRPQKLAGDLSTDLEVMTDLLRYFKSNEKKLPSMIVHLRPTYPVRLVSEINQSIDIMKKNQCIDSLRSIAEINYSGYKMWNLLDDKRLRPISNEILDGYNLPRQMLPKTYIQNASIDIIRTKTILEQESMTGKNIYGYLMNHFFDIDYEDELYFVEKILEILEGKSIISIRLNTVLELIQLQKNKSSDFQVIIDNVFQLGNQINLINHTNQENKVFEEFKNIFGHEITSFNSATEYIWSLRDLKKLNFLEGYYERKETVNYL